MRRGYEGPDTRLNPFPVSTFCTLASTGETRRVRRTHMRESSPEIQRDGTERHRSRADNYGGAEHKCHGHTTRHPPPSCPRLSWFLFWVVYPASPIFVVASTPTFSHLPPPSPQTHLHTLPLSSTPGHTPPSLSLHKPKPPTSTSPRARRRLPPAASSSHPRRPRRIPSHLPPFVFRRSHDQLSPPPPP